MGILAAWTGVGLADGTPVDTSTAGDGDTAFTTVTAGAFTVDTTGLHGPRLQVDQAAATAAELIWDSTVVGTTLTAWAARVYVELSDWPPSNGGRLLSAYTASNTLIWFCDFTTAGIFRLRNAGGSAVDSSTVPLPADAELRIEAVHNNGAVTVTVYTGDGDTVLADVSATGLGTGSTLQALRFGMPATSPTWSRLWLDEMALADTAAEIGPAPNPAIPRVELQLGGTWTDVTPYVQYGSRIKITRGQKSEGKSGLDNATCDLTFTNDGGRFSPRHPTSPYYGLLGRNTPIRVTAGGGYRFHGEVAEWPPKRDISGKDATVSVKAAGVSRRLKQGDQALRSPIFRSVSSIGSVVSYWPMEDAKEATTIAASDSATAPMRIFGTPDMAGYDEFTSSEPLPVCGTGKFTGTVVPYFASGELLIRLFVFVQEPVTAETSLLRVSLSGTARVWEITLFDDGDLGTYAYDKDGTQLVSNRTAFFLNTLGYLTVDLQLTQDGADIDWVTRAVDFTNTDRVDDEFAYRYKAGTLTGRTFGQARGVVVGNGGGLAKVVVGHLLMCTHIADVFDDGGVLGGFATDWVYKALVAYNGENPTNRMTRLCTEEGVAFTVVNKGITSGNFVHLGDQPSKSLLDLVQEAGDSDLGILFEPRDSLGLAYRSRLSMYNQAAALTLSCSAHELNEALEPTDDDQGTVNDITVKREAGSSVRFEQTTGPLSTAAPEDGGVGRYDTSVTLSLVDDIELPDQAGWRLHLGTVDEARYPKVTVHLSHPAFTADPALKAAALAVDVGDRLVITNPSPDLPPDDISQIVIGYSEVIDQFEHVITFVCQPESPWRVGVLETAGFDRLDSDGAALAADATSTATALSVASSGPLWTTDAGDLPFDVMVAGERMTVTAISGTSSPQAFTVTRSVNGVVKAQSSGAAVAIAEPVAVAL